MRNAIFIGEHDLTLDEKNRLLVPSDVRKAMKPDRDGEGFYLIIGINRKPWLFPERYYEQLLEREGETLPPEAELNQDPRRLDDWLKRFAMARRVAWDKQGRILLPETTLRRTETRRDVTLVGVRNHLQLWNRDDWENRFDDLLDGRGESGGGGEDDGGPG
jgi:MraZ protein